MLIRPKDIAEYMYFRAYGKRHPTPEDKPKLTHCSNLATIKKSISYFMPNKEAWNPGYDWRNPTKSKEANDVIKVVKKTEIRGQGRASKVVRPFTKKEEKKLIEDARTSMRFDISYGVVALFLFAYHSIFRLDDACK